MQTLAALAEWLGHGDISALAATGFFMLAGQSNQGGQGSYSATTGGADTGYGIGTPFAAVTQNQHLSNAGVTDPITWIDTGTQTLRPYAAAGQPNMGPEQTLGRYLYNYGAFASPILVKCAVGGSSLRRHWLNASYPVSGGSLFSQFVTYWLAREAEFGKQIDALFWLQGETDATDATDAAQYQTNLGTFFTNLRNALNRPTLKIVLGKLNSQHALTFVSTIRAAQVAYVASDPLCTLFSFDDVPLATDPHYNARSLCTIGERGAVALINATKPTAANHDQGSGSIPWFQGADVGVDGAGALTPRWPAEVKAGDIGILVATSYALANTITLSDAQGFTEVTSSPVRSTFSSVNKNVAIYWKRVTQVELDANGGRPIAPTVADSNDQNAARIFVFRGCVASGDPVDVVVTGKNNNNNTSLSIAAGTSTTNNCLLAAFATTGAGAATGTQISAFTNASLANLTKHWESDYTPAAGHMGIALVTGQKAAAGAFNATAFTYAGNAVTAGLALALKGT